MNGFLTRVFSWLVRKVKGTWEALKMDLTISKEYKLIGVSMRGYRTCQPTQGSLKMEDRDWEEESKNWVKDYITTNSNHRNGGWDSGDDPRIDT